MTLVCLRLCICSIIVEVSLRNIISFWGNGCFEITKVGPWSENNYSRKSIWLTRVSLCKIRSSAQQQQRNGRKLRALDFEVQITWCPIELTWMYKLHKFHDLLVTRIQTVFLVKSIIPSSNEIVRLLIWNVPSIKWH